MLLINCYRLLKAWIFALRQLQCSKLRHMYCAGYPLHSAHCPLAYCTLNAKAMLLMQLLTNIVQLP